MTKKILVIGGMRGNRMKQNPGLRKIANLPIQSGMNINNWNMNLKIKIRDNIKDPGKGMGKVGGC